jgi:hypothetical protein
MKVFYGEKKNKKRGNRLNEKSVSLNKSEENDFV